MPLQWFLVLIVFAYSGSVTASEREKTYPVKPAVTLRDSLSNSKAVSKSFLSLAGNSSIIVPDGFIRRPIKKGDSLAKICNADSICEVVFMKVNRLDNRHFPLGKNVFVPVEVSRAILYVPVPQTLADSRGEREIRIFLGLQYFGAYEKGQLFFWGPVSSGKKDRSTPPGKFFVNYKQRFKHSVKYENAPMPFSINYHNGYFIHQQSLPGYPASHGCIRLLPDDAERLFSWARIGDPVTVVKEL
jgi:hypothetical protein